jgi:DNA-binding XRE family transcriptional regulator
MANMAERVPTGARFGNTGCATQVAIIEDLDMTVFQERLKRMDHKQRAHLQQAVGVRRSTIYRWRTGATMPERAVALRVIDYFKGAISMDDIYRGARHGHD